MYIRLQDFVISRMARNSHFAHVKNCHFAHSTNTQTLRISKINEICTQNNTIMSLCARSKSTHLHTSAHGVNQHNYVILRIGKMN